MFEFLKDGQYNWNPERALKGRFKGCEGMEHLFMGGVMDPRFVDLGTEMTLACDLTPNGPVLPKDKRDKFRKHWETRCKNDSLTARERLGAEDNLHRLLAYEATDPAKMGRHMAVQAALWQILKSL